jgi:hypothetical protein
MFIATRAAPLQAQALIGPAGSADDGGAIICYLYLIYPFLGL